MKFQIRRTSIWDGRPCKEARLESFVYVDRRTVKTLEEAKLPKYKHWADDFFASGTNHREENGMVARDLEEQDVWVIDINTFEELIKLNDKYGNIIVGFVDSYKGLDRYIEIYDDYRE